ncbi:MAG: TonB family protein [Xanthomonadales bacterium]|nr:TonB family protein [Xanthomonadales bacterium]
MQGDTRKSSPVTYPEDSKARGEQGTVILKIVPSSSGRVQSVNLEKSSRIPLLDEWATADVRSWIFDPDACAGVTMSIPIKYEQLKMLGPLGQA